MPFGIRQKMMAAVAMLLVASLLMVTSTYAWFTLSTAPEVTGITTSVGANGNLEIALLTTGTYANTANIASATGNSYAATHDYEVTNITWGNLVDLSNAAYGLANVKLQPAEANIVNGSLSTTNLLKTPVYGADGRVNTVDANTVSAILANGAFTKTETQDYGVRAVGTASGMSARQLLFINAVGAFNNGRSSAASQLSNAVNNNSGVLMNVAAAGSTPSSYTAAQVSGMLAMVKGAQNSLNSIVKSYVNYAIANAVQGDAEVSDETITALAAAANVTDAAAAKTALGNSAPGVLDGLATQQAAVAEAITTLEQYKDNGTENNAEATTAVTEALKKLFAAVTDGNGATLSSASAASLMSNGGSIYITGGAVGAIADQLGGITLSTVEALGVTVTAFAGTRDQAAGALTSIDISSLTAPAGSTDAAAITDTYGYAIDFAFRTNAAESYLKLQTSAANRVYDGTELQDGQGVATQGSGSVVTFTHTDELSAAQAAKLLENVRIIFFNPENGTIYANARLNDITEGAAETTAKVQLYTDTDATVTVGQDFYTPVYDTENHETITGYAVKDLLTINEVDYSSAAAGAAVSITTEEYGNLPPASSVSTTGGFIAETSDANKIVDLNQNEVKKVSVLVYLDGNTIQNSDVINAAESGTLKLNLQFASSADLVPMNNTALKNLQDN